MAARLGLGPLLAGAAAGAYGMNQVSSSNWGNLWGLVPRSPWDSAGASTSAAGTPELSALRGEMGRLANLVSDLARSGQGKPTVVHLGGRSGWTVLVYPAVAGGACLYLYCKVTGTGVMDLLFVSRSSLSAFRNTVQEGLSNMWGEMRRQKEEFVKMVSTLGMKQDQLQDNQDQLMVKQSEMDSLLHRVDDNVDGLDAKANHTINHVNQMDGRLQDVHVGVQAANQGIYMLMSVVSEVTSKIGLHNSRATQTLHRYLQGGPAWGGSIANTSANTGTTSSSVASIDSAAAIAAASSSNHSRNPSDAPLLPLPSLANSHGCEVSVDGEGGKGGSRLRSSSSSLGGLRDLMHGVGGSESRTRAGFSSFGSNAFGGSGSLSGGGQQHHGEGSKASEGMVKESTGMLPAGLAGGRLPNLSVP